MHSHRTFLRSKTYIVDLRSDTTTKPTTAMKHAMVNSALGDDVFKEDPTVNALEAKIATMLGKQAALFVPSGTMANLIAVMVHCHKRGSEALVGDLSHIYRSEQGGASHLGGVLLSTVANKQDGTFDLREVARRIRGAKMNEPITSVIAVENTHNVCGGKVLSLDWLDELAQLCKARSLPLHMDGARLFNAAAYLQQSPSRIVRDCDSVSVCFSKGLSAPVGSALLGCYHFIEQARRLRKMLGGGMRQAGVLAAAALVALEEVVPLLQLDHKRAYKLAREIHALSLKTFTVEVEGQQSNIVLVRIPAESAVTAVNVVQRLGQICLQEIQGDCKTDDDEGIIVKAISFDEKTLRLTLHRDISDEDLWLAIMKIKYVFREMDVSYQ